MGFLILNLVMAAFIAYSCGVIARRTGRDAMMWTILGFFFGIFAVLALAILNHFAKKKRLASLKQKIILTAPAVPDPLESRYWYYLNPQQQQQGPMNLQQLKEAWDSQAINGKSYVWYEQLSEWKRIEELQLLNERLQLQK